MDEILSGKIFNIQKFSIHDGPGIRTTIFFKGCNLRCIWCHNPESYDFSEQLMFNNELCIGCGECFNKCTQNAHTIIENSVHIIDRKKCTLCKKCVENCFSKAISCAGYNISSEKLMEIILEDKLYYNNSNGGVTFSGGECMLQPIFLTETLKKCKKNSIHTAVDTAGNVDFKFFKAILDYTDLFLYDIKAFDEDVHKCLTGVSNKLILENFEKLLENNAKIYVRIPIIMGKNDNQMPKIADFLSNFNIERIELLPFHKMGQSKRILLNENISEDMETPNETQISEIYDLFKLKNLNVYR